MFDLMFPQFDADGNMLLNDRYKEILVLDKMLTEAGIPHTIEQFYDGWQLFYPEDGENCVMDTIEHYGSYGRAADRLEIMGLLTPEEAEIDEVVGWLTAQDVFERIKKHYEKVRETE